MKVVTGVHNSRRLGRSLGINLFKSKTCNLNCIYCECGENSIYKKEKPYSYDEIIEEIDMAMKEYNYFDYITFSGLGEPTIHPDFARVISYVKKNLNTKICIITNSTTIGIQEIAEVLHLADTIMPSLDAISESVFKKLNRPNNEVNLEEILAGLKQFSKSYQGDMCIEIFFSDSINDSENELKELAFFLKDIQYNRIDINSLDRAAAIDGLEKMSLSKREEIKAYFESFGLKNISII